MSFDINYSGGKLSEAVEVDKNTDKNKNDNFPNIINININIRSIELKWDGKITKIWYDNDMR